VFRLPLLVALTLAIAFGGGVWSASWMLKATSGFGAIRLGSWSAYPDLQTAVPIPLPRRTAPATGGFCSAAPKGWCSPPEAIETGAALSGPCSYEISGHDAAGAVLDAASQRCGWRAAPAPDGFRSA
jgi:hypothetical protein